MEVRWITTCLTDEPTEESAPKVADWEGYCTLHVAIDVLTHGNGIRHSGFEGQSMETTRGILVVVACALRLLQKTGTGTQASTQTPSRTWPMPSPSARSARSPS